MVSRVVQCSYGLNLATLGPIDLELSCHGPGEGLPLLDILTWIRGRWLGIDDKSKQRIIKSITWYLPQRTSILAWLETGVLHLQDEVPFFPGERKFEQQRLLNHLGQLIGKLLHEPGEVWVLREFHNASPALVALCSELQDIIQPGRLSIWAEIGSIRQWSISRMDDPWYNFLEQLEHGDLVYPDSRPPGLAHKATKPIHHRVVQAEPRDVISHCMAWGAWYELIHGYANFGFMDLPGWFLVLEKMGRPDEAFLGLNQAWNRRKQLPSQDAWDVGLALLRIYSNKRNYDEVLRLMGILGKFLEAHPDPHWALSFQIHEIFYFDLMGWPPEAHGVWNHARESALELQWFSHVSYLDGLLPLHGRKAYLDGFDAAKQEALAALQRAQNIGNLYRVSVLFHILGYLHEGQGFNTEALGWFQKGITLRRKLGDPVELIKVYNGTGYFCFSTGDFTTALQYYRQALDLLKDQRDFIEACLTLFNMVLIHIFSGHHEVALLLLGSILEIMNVLGDTQLPWHRRSKLLALAAYAASHLGRHTLAEHYLGTILASDIDEQAAPYVGLARGRIKKDLAILQNEQDALRPHHGRFLKVQFAVEICLREGGDAKKLHEIEVSTRNQGLIVQADWIRFLSLGKKVPQYPGKNTLETLLASLKLSAHQEAGARKLVSSLREMNFLSTFQTALGSAPNREELLSRTKTLWVNHFSPRLARIRHVSGLGGNEGGPDLRVWLSDGLYGSVEIALLPAQGILYGDDDRRLFAVCSAHLRVVWDLIRTREELDKASAHDPLTGVFTRKEILRRAELERRRCIRYGGDERRFAILFIDLDNFKYYNDAYGHEVGDYVLKVFCRLVNSVLREVDVFGRYGGDEFLIVLPETREPGAHLGANRILNALAQAEGFSEDLLAQDLIIEAIPQEKWLGASIGVSVWQRGGGDVEDLVREADAYVYQAKARGKNQVVFPKEP